MIVLDWTDYAAFWQSLRERGERPTGRYRIDAQGRVAFEVAPPVETGPDWRADNEPQWAAVMDRLGIRWQYEALEDRLSRALRYMPDFWLPDQEAWLEIKSSRPTKGEVRVAQQLRDATDCRVYIVWGKPARGRFGVGIFSEAGDRATTRPDWAALALCQLWDCNFSELWGAMR